MIEFILLNWQNIALAITGIVTAASIIAKMTPTEVDDNILGNIIIFMDKLGLNNKPTEINKESKAVK